MFIKCMDRYTPARLKISAAIGTVELTGLEMMHTQASGHVDAMASHRTATMPALMLKRSSRVMPGLRGTPAGRHMQETHRHTK